MSSIRTWLPHLSIRRVIMHLELPRIMLDIDTDKQVPKSVTTPHLLLMSNSTFCKIVYVSAVRAILS